MTTVAVAHQTIFTNQRGKKADFDHFEGAHLRVVKVGERMESAFKQVSK